MKKNLIFIALVSILVSACTGGSVDKAKIQTEQDSVSYVIGFENGSAMAKNMVTFPGGMNFEEFTSAFASGFQGEEPDFEVEDLNSYVMTYVREVQTDTSGTVAESPKRDSVCNALGRQYGSDFSENTASFPGGMNKKAFLEAFVTGFNGDTARIVVDDSRSFIMTYVEKAIAIEAETDSVAVAGKEFLAENAKKEGVVTTESGLQYEIITEGTGEIPTSASTVKVHYHGTLIDGSVFDSSVERGEPATFGVTRVIKGWTEALQLMPVGSKWKLYIPQDLAYGSDSRNPKIPAYSTLIFEVELLEIVN